MSKIFNHLLLLLFIVSTSCSAQSKKNDVTVRTGAEMLIENHLDELKGKRVGLVINHTARVGNAHVMDTLISSGINITSIFAPEHGYRGERADGELIEDGVDKITGLPVYSLHGASKRPTPQMMESVDILLFDMQDVGARFYTYNSTMKYILEAGAEFKKEVWILDRPNPAGGEYVAGWVLEEEFKSFVGSYPIPVAHGLTLGELALMAIGEGWLDSGAKPKLKVITLKGWSRLMKWPDTNLPWIPPSPNLPTFDHAFVYLGTCFFEGVNITEGRGTEDPFLTIGTPEVFFEPEELEGLEKEYHIRIDTISFIPRSITGKSLYPKFEGEKILGISLQPTKEFSKPVEFGLDLLTLFKKKLSLKDKEFIYREHLFLLGGTSQILDWNSSPNWGEPFDDFVANRRKYLLYN